MVIDRKGAEFTDKKHTNTHITHIQTLSFIIYVYKAMYKLNKKTNLRLVISSRHNSDNATDFL